MRLLLQDFSGHPCQVHLARMLARYNDVSYVFCTDYETGQGRTRREPDDPDSLTFTGVSMGGGFDKYSPGRRLQQELTYAVRLARIAVRGRFELVVLSNTPLLSLVMVALALRFKRLPYVFWQQDVYSEAISKEAAKRGGLYRPIGWVAVRFEAWVARGAASVVPISDGFLPVLRSWKVAAAKIHVIPNWAPVEEIPPVSRPTAWQQARGLATGRLVVYSGTIGLKHSLDSLLNVAVALLSVDPTATLVVVTSAEVGRNLAAVAADRGITNLRTFEFQPYAELPEVLGSADAFVVVLEPAASRYSVPSKVLAYLCAGRPIIAVIPSDNDVAATLATSGAGIVVSESVEDLAAALRRVFQVNEAAQMGTAARRYAEVVFAEERVLPAFERAFGISPVDEVHVQRYARMEGPT